MAERGSTLLEMLVALAVLAIGVAGGARLLLLGVAAESEAALREAATQRLADAAELAWAWSGAPPAVQLAEWQAAATALRPGLPGAVTATLDPLPALDGGPRSLLASLRWGNTPAASAALRLSVHEAAAAP